MGAVALVEGPVADTPVVGAVALVEGPVADTLVVGVVALVEGPVADTLVEGAVADTLVEEAAVDTLVEGVAGTDEVPVDSRVVRHSPDQEADTLGWLEGLRMVGEHSLHLLEVGLVQFPDSLY